MSAPSDKRRLAGPAQVPAHDRPRRRGVFTRLGTPGKPRSRLRRRVGAGLRMIAALTLVGGLYAGFSPAANAEGSSRPPDPVQGKGYFDTSCASCHGSGGQGVKDRGPSLIGVGSAAVEFQVSTGRMPLARQEAQAERKKPQFSDDQARDIGAYIDQLGGGPKIPDGDNLHQGGDISNGGRLFRENCASCHQNAANGGALSSGKFAPSIRATDRQIYGAMLSGPESMPV